MPAWVCVIGFLFTVFLSSLSMPLPAPAFFLPLCFPGLTYADGVSSAGIVLSLIGQVTVSFEVPKRVLLSKPALCS